MNVKVIIIQDEFHVIRQYYSLRTFIYEFSPIPPVNIRASTIPFNGTVIYAAMYFASLNIQVTQSDYILMNIIQTS